MFQGTMYGSVTYNGKVYYYDILVFPDGRVEPRHKYHSNSLFATTHEITKDEIKVLLSSNPQVLIIGTGQEGNASLTEDAELEIRKARIKAIVGPTPQAIERYNQIVNNRKVAALIHVTD